MLNPIFSDTLPAAALPVPLVYLLHASPPSTSYKRLLQLMLRAQARPSPAVSVLPQVPLPLQMLTNERVPPPLLPSASPELPGSCQGLGQGGDGSALCPVG